MMAFTRTARYNTDQIKRYADATFEASIGVMQSGLEVAYDECTPFAQFVVRSAIGSHERTTAASQGHAQLQQAIVRLRQGKRIEAPARYVLASAIAVLPQVLASQVLSLRQSRSSTNGSLATRNGTQLSRYGSVEYATNVSRVQCGEKQSPAANVGVRSIRCGQTEASDQVSGPRDSAGLDASQGGIKGLFFVYKFLQGLKFRRSGIEKRLGVLVNTPYVTQSTLCYIKIGGVA